MIKLSPPTLLTKHNLNFLNHVDLFSKIILCKNKKKSNSQQK